MFSVGHYIELHLSARYDVIMAHSSSSEIVKSRSSPYPAAAIAATKGSGDLPRAPLLTSTGAVTVFVGAAAAATGAAFSNARGGRRRRRQLRPRQQQRRQQR